MATIKAEVRVASSPGNGMFTLEINGSTRGDAFTVNRSGGWQSSETLSTSIGHLNKGSQTLRVQVQAGGFNTNWIKLSLEDDGSNGGGNLDSSKASSGNFDLKDWYLSVPTDNDDSGTADSIKDKLVSGSGYTNNDYFYTANDGGMVFRSTIDGYKTSTNTNFTRSELREMLG